MLHSSSQRLRHELHILGAINLALPVIVAAIYLGFSILVYYSARHNGGTLDYAHYQATRGMLALLENGLPLAAGLAAAILISHDPVVESHLTFSQSYHATATLRLALITLWTTLFTALVALLVAATGFWPTALQTLSPIENVVLWLAPLWWFIGAGAALALLLRSRVASMAILGMVWVAQFLFKLLFLQSEILQRVYLFLTEEDGLPSYWLANRLIILAIALALFGVTLLLLRRDEALLGPES